MIPDIPKNLLKSYTRGGTIPLEYQLMDDSRPEIQQHIAAQFNEVTFEKYLGIVSRRELNYYGDTDRWLYGALEQYPIRGFDVCIFGSANPWYEAVAVTFGAKSVTVIEHSSRPSFHPKILYVKPRDSGGLLFDAGISISSFEHYGLGRYGDPLDPDGDLKAMDDAKCSLGDHSRLFLSVPIGEDLICYNSHRVYGNDRYPLLVEGWKVLAEYGIRPSSFQETVNKRQTPYQPVFVLEK